MVGLAPFLLLLSFCVFSAPECTGAAVGGTVPVADVVAIKPRKRRIRRTSVQYAFSVQEFCDAHSISRSQYYALRKLRQGPAETRILGKILITVESAAMWRKRRTAATVRAARRT